MTAVRKLIPLHSNTFATKAKKQQQKDRLIDSAWWFAYTTLFSNQTYSETEIKKFKFQIREHFEGFKSPQKAFKNFCERIVLAKWYIEKHKLYRIEFPSVWLNKNYEYGFTQTAIWQKKIDDKRVLIADHHKGLSTIAKAIMVYTLNPSQTIFLFYRNQFLIRNEYKLLQLFYNTIIHLNLLNQ